MKTRRIKTSRFLLTSGAIFCLAASTALAQDWAGKYAGGSFSFNNSTVEWTDILGGWYTPAPGSSYSATQITASFGGQYGQLYQNNNLVFGWELGLASVGHNLNVDSPFYPVSDDFTTRLDNVFTATARAGFSTGKFLPYLEAGIALGKIGLTNTDDLDLIGPEDCRTTPCVLDLGGMATAPVLGIGVDYKVSDKVFVGLDYRYMNFAGQNYSGYPSNLTSVEYYNLGGSLGTLSLRVNMVLD